MKFVRHRPTVAALLLFGLILVGCPLLSPGHEATGKVSVVMQASGARTILPGISVASYRISFSGPVVHDPVSTTQANATIELEAGTWDISVDGLDSGGTTVVVGGQTGVVVSAGSTTSVSIVLSAQASGSGTIDVTVSWPTLTPAIDAVETTLEGIAVPGGTVSFTTGAATMRYVQAKAAGSYALCITLKSGGALRASVQEAVQVYGNLTSSATITLTTADFTQVPAAPGTLTVTEGFAKLDLGWVDNSHVETGYVVERGTAEAGPFGALAGMPLAANTTSYSDTTVTAGTPYWYRVKARNQIGDSDPLSATSAIMVAPPVGGGSGALTYSNVSSSSIRVNWTKATDNVSTQSALQYKVVRSLANNISTVAQAEANGTLVMDWTTDVATVNVTGLSAATVYWFNVLVRDVPGNTGAYLSSSQATASVTAPQIIADHTVVDKYATIPQVWIDEVKKMWFDLPGESHSLGYRKGLSLLASLDARFAVAVVEGGTPDGPTAVHLRASRATWGDVGSPSGWIYGYGEEDWYTSATAISRTKAHLSYSNANNFAIAAFGFGWCWDMTWTNGPGGTEDPVYKVRWAGSSNGGPQGNLRWGLDSGDQILTGNSVSMDTYLDATQQYIAFCSSNGYATKVFFSTGPVDTEDNPSAEAKYQRQIKNDYIRNYISVDSSRILFDYADILAWNDAGVQNTGTWTDAYATSHSYQEIHYDNTRDIGGGYTDDYDHIGTQGALRLGKAVWWMLARMAGWDGLP